jgi:hypothetical protein
MNEVAIKRSNKLINDFIFQCVCIIRIVKIALEHLASKFTPKTPCQTCQESFSQPHFLRLITDPFQMCRMGSIRKSESGSMRGTLLSSLVRVAINFGTTIYKPSLVTTSLKKMSELAKTKLEPSGVMGLDFCSYVMSQEW